MSLMPDFTNPERLQQSLMLGLANNPLPDNAAAPLTQLALLAAWNRAMRPQLPAFGAHDRPNPTALRYLSAESRRALLRLVAAKKPAVSEGLFKAAFAAIRASGLALHPFDFAKMEDVLARNTDLLSEPERRWLRQVRPEKELADSPYDGPSLSEETLGAAPKGAKLAFLTLARSTDPAKARAMIEALFASEPAAIRGEMLKLLSVNLNDADRPFLETLLNDRAQSVKDGAEALLSTLPGTEAFQKRMARIKDQIQIKSEGLIIRRKALVYMPPADVKPNMHGEAQRNLLAGLSLKHLAGVLGESEASLLALAGKSDKAGDIPLLILIKAVEIKMFAEAQREAHLVDDDNGTKALELLTAVAPQLTPLERIKLARIFLHPERWKIHLQLGGSEKILDYFEGPLPQDLALTFLGAPFFLQTPDQLMDTVCQAYAPLIPASLSEQFIAQFESQSPAATNFHRFLLSLQDTTT